VENVLDRSVVAPYALSPIPLFLSSVTGFKYRTINCMECGAEFLERNNDVMYRLNDYSQPQAVLINGEVIQTSCGKCQQSYHVQVSINVTYEQGGIPMHLQPQSVYITAEPAKKLRYLHCMECGKAFHSPYLTAYAK
jgi:DNA-directed RNA polymerase subunit RPC12/RpoP